PGVRGIPAADEATASGGGAPTDLRRERVLESGQVVVVGRDVVIELVREGRAVDERRKVRRDRGRQLRGVAEVRRDVGEILDDVRVVALTKERGGDPAAVSRVVLDHMPAFSD